MHQTAALKSWHYRRRKGKPYSQLEIFHIAPRTTLLKSSVIWGPNGGESIYSDKTACTSKQQLSASSGSRDWIHRWNGTENTFNNPQEFQIQNRGVLLALRTYLHHYMHTHTGEKEVAIFPSYILFIPCLFVGFGSTSKSEGNIQQH